MQIACHFFNVVFFILFFLIFKKTDFLSFLPVFAQKIAFFGKKSAFFIVFCIFCVIFFFK